jgi:DNA-binding MarR family transcriptional regulator
VFITISDSKFTIYLDLFVHYGGRAESLLVGIPRAVWSVHNRGITMQNVERTLATETPTPYSLLKQAEALQAQAAELAAIINRADNDHGTALETSKGTAALAKGIIRARTQRSKFLPPSLFAEPAWDILLELYSAELAQQRMTVTQACAAAKVPATTALRWLGTLEASQLIVRHPDPLDARRSFVALTETGEQAMESFFQSIKDAVLAA